MRAAASLDQIKRIVAEEFGVSVESLALRRGGEPKMAAIYLARKLSGMLGREVGREFGVRGARVSNVVSEIEGGGRKPLSPRLERLRRRLEAEANV